MPTAEAWIRTDRAARYLAQLCGHASQLGRDDHSQGHGDDRAPRPVRVDRDDTDGVMVFDRGRCTLRATDRELVLAAEAEDGETLRLIQDALAARLELIGRRDGLTVTWGSAPPVRRP